jgi:hypothetical protein
MSRAFRLTAPKPSENDIEAGCITILHLHSYYVIRQHCGVFESLDGRRKIRGAPKGTPDYACMHETHRGFLLEVKRPGGTLSDDQKVMNASIELRYRLPIVVVETVDQLCDFLAKHERSP